MGSIGNIWILRLLTEVSLTIVPRNNNLKVQLPLSFQVKWIYISSHPAYLFGKSLENLRLLIRYHENRQWISLRGTNCVQ